MRAMNSAGLSRRSLIVSGAALLVAARLPTGRSPRVLFVCQKGTVKSPIARELMRQQAATRALAVRAQSRGITPREGASAEVSAALIQDGIDVRRDRLRALTKADCEWADVVVFFDPLPFELTGKDLRDWRDTPSVNQHYSQALGVMNQRIAALVEELALRR